MCRYFIVLEKCKYKHRLFMQRGQFFKSWPNISLPDSVLHKLFRNNVISVSNSIFITFNVMMERKWKQYSQSVLRNVVSKNCQFVMLLDALETQWVQVSPTKLWNSIQNAFVIAVTGWLLLLLYSNCYCCHLWHSGRSQVGSDAVLQH